MKRLIVFIFISALLAGTIFAQNNDNRPEKNDRKRETAKVTIEGVLQLDKGIVTVASGDSIYYVPRLNLYISFIEGLKEGAKVSVEGSQFNKIIRPVKVTIEGKSYDFPDFLERNKNNRFSQGREQFKLPRNLNNRERQARPFSRSAFGKCCR